MKEKKTWIIERAWDASLKDYSEEMLMVGELKYNDTAGWVFTHESGFYHTIDILNDKIVYQIVDKEVEVDCDGTYKFPTVFDLIDSKKIEDIFSFGWISPNGNMFPCNPLAHLDKAKELYGMFYNKESDTPDDELLNLGWIKVTYKKYIGYDYKITDAQAEILLKRNIIKVRGVL